MPAGRRRSARFNASLFVGIPEAAGEPELESCNISASGMLLRTPRDAGAPGAVRMLRLVTADMSTAIEIMSRVIKVIAYEDAERGRVMEATTFEFLAQGDKNRVEIEDFLRLVVEAEFSTAPSVSADRGSADLLDEGGTAGELGVSGMVIDAGCAVELGAKVSVEIETPSSSGAVQLSGRAVGRRHIQESGEDERYYVQVSFGNGKVADVRREERGGAGVAAGANTAASEQADSGGSHQQREGSHLSGALSEVALTSLLGFFELERASGVLRLDRDSDKAALFVRDGSILDVYSDPAAPSPIDALANLLAWPDGAFEFTFQSVERPDTIGQSTTSLLMECMQRMDESSHQESSG